MKQHFLFLFLIFFISGCASLNYSKKEKETMDSWLGNTKANLIQSWGPPNRTTNDGQGGEILIYERSVNLFQSPGTVYTQPYNNNIYYTQPQNNVVTRARMFYINNKGVIYHWLCQGRRGY